MQKQEKSASFQLFILFDIFGRLSTHQQANDKIFVGRYANRMKLEFSTLAGDKYNLYKFTLQAFVGVGENSGGIFS